MIQFKQKEIEKVIGKVRQSIKAGDGVPKVKITATNGKTYKLTRKKYNGILKQYNLYQFNNGKKPSKVTYVGKSKIPFVLNYQDNKYQCCCASFNMAAQGLGEFIHESKIAKAFQTGIYGTSPSDMITGAKKLGYKIEPIKRNFESVKQAISKGYGVIAHIDTIKAPCLGYANNYGHYICIGKTTKNGNYWVYDPTKGFKSVKASCIDNAMLNRTINYYQVMPL